MELYILTCRSQVLHSIRIARVGQRRKKFFNFFFHRCTNSLSLCAVLIRETVRKNPNKRRDASLLYEQKRSLQQNKKKKISIFSLRHSVTKLQVVGRAAYARNHLHRRISRCEHISQILGRSKSHLMGFLITTIENKKWNGQFVSSLPMIFYSTFLVSQNIQKHVKLKMNKFDYNIIVETLKFH